MGPHPQCFEIFLKNQLLGYSFLLGSVPPPPHTFLWDTPTNPGRGGGLNEVRILAVPPVGVGTAEGRRLEPEGPVSAGQVGRVRAVLG